MHQYGNIQIQGHLRRARNMQESNEYINGGISLIYLTRMHPI